MPRRRPGPKISHHTIVQVQKELLEWCSNVEGVPEGDLEWVCWACGMAPLAKEKKYRPCRCHINLYVQNELERPDNFILLCDRCHREQPDALPKEILKYWLATHESITEYLERLLTAFNVRIGLLRKEFGDLVVDVASEELGAEIRDRWESWIENYLQNRSAGQGTGNRNANIEWGWIVLLYQWCAANKESVESEWQRRRLELLDAIEQQRLEKEQDLHAKQRYFSFASDRAAEN